MTTPHPAHRALIVEKTDDGTHARIVTGSEDLLGDGDVLARAESVLERGNPAARMREIFQDTGSFPDVVRWVADETTSMTR